MESLGRSTDRADIEIGRGVKMLREIQAKSCKNRTRRRRLVNWRRRITKGTLKADDYRKAVENLKGEVAYGKVRSGGTTTRESLDALVCSRVRNSGVTISA